VITSNVRFELVPAGRAQEDLEPVLALLPDLKDEDSELNQPRLSLERPRVQRELRFPSARSRAVGANRAVRMDGVVPFVPRRDHDDPSSPGEIVDRPLDERASVVASGVPAEAAVDDGGLVPLRGQIEDMGDSGQDVRRLESRLHHSQIGFGSDSAKGIAG
jgi:hypothetical protein